MNLSWRSFLRVAILVFLTILFGGFQTSAWYLVFGNFPPPMLWLVLLVYIAVTRSLFSAIWLTYILSFFNAAFTALPFGLMLGLSLMTIFILISIRKHFYWGGKAYFVIIVGATTFVWPIGLWIASRAYDTNPIFIPAAWDWLLSALMTALVSPVFFSLLEWIEAKLNDERASDFRLGTQ